MGKYCFGIDVGGTSVKCGLFQTDGVLVEKWEIPTRRENNGEAIIPDIAKTILDKIAERKMDKEDIDGVGIGVPGPVNERGEVPCAVNLYWGFKEVTKELSELTGLASKAGNDANVAALGEAWKGAAAGSGNTAVLVERIITLLTKVDPPMYVDRLLSVTFTEAAASEMKERIRLAIEKKLMEYPDNEHLKQQATLIHNAQITTIHSFCLSVIRDHFHAIDIAPGFRIGEEGELKLLRHDVLEDMLEEKYQEGSKCFLDFTAAYSTGRNDKKIEDLILKIYEFSRSYPDSEAWLDSCVKAYEIPDVKALEGSSIMKEVMTDIRKNLEDAKEASEMIQEATWNIPGVLNVSSDAGNNTTQLRVVVDPLSAMSHGMTPAQVAGGLYSMLSGTTAMTVTSDGEEYDVDLEFP